MKKIQLTQGKLALVDDEDFDYLTQYKWYPLNKKSRTVSYVCRSYKKNKKNYTLLMHRVVMKVKKDTMIDHIDGNGLNNQKSNLRVVTATQNQWNRAANKNNTSGYKGVSYIPKYQKWYPRIRIGGGKRLSLGFFSTKEEAYAVYLEATKKYHGEFSRTS